MSKETKIIIMLTLIMIMFQSRVNAFTKDTKEVVINKNGNIYTIKTKVNTIKELLEDENIILEEHDYINKNLEDLLLNNVKNELVIKKGIKIKIIKDRKEEDFWALEGYVAEDIVREIYENTGRIYLYDKEIIDTKLVHGQKIHLYNLETKEVFLVKNIPFKTEIVYNNNLLNGKEKILNKGEKGEKSIKFKVELLDGKEIKRQIIEEKITKNPKNAIKEIGNNQRKLNQNNFINNKVINDNKFFNNHKSIITMRATAYSAQQPQLSNKTATGRAAVKGVVAVDPKFIPLGTKLYIEGYGNAIAADTGGDIKGNRIDLCYNTIAEALKFGRRTIKVYIME